MSEARFKTKGMVVSGCTSGGRAYLDLLEGIILNKINPENGARVKFLVDQLTIGEPTAWDRNKLIAELVSLHRSNGTIRTALAELDRPRHWWIKTLGFPFSMIGPKRLSNVRLAAETVIGEGVPGAMIETGVWRGGACIMMKGVMRSLGETRPLFVCDSFAGLPALDEGPDSVLALDENPILTAPLEDVRSHFERLGLLDDDVHFVKGWFSDTMAGVKNDVADQGIAVLRLDGDYYKSTMDVLDPLYPHVQPGGFVIIDDYHAYEQCRQAVEEYRSTHAITEPIIEIDGMGVYWRVEA